MRADGRARRWSRLAAALALAALASGPTHATETVPDDLTELSLGELAQIEVTSAAKRPERRFTTANAIYVITADDIRRSGVRHLAEALRLAPGVQVARIDANKWSVGVRGFGSRLSRAVLVLIDGRSVYDPLFAGVYWEAQDTLLDDVERIEVIRGPGGTLWGANAVNGVINIITRHAAETQGGLVGARAGDQERFGGRARYGGRAGAWSYRVYGQGFTERGFAEGATFGRFDDWRMVQGGFHADWDKGAADSLSVQGDIYRGRAGEIRTITTLEPPFSSQVTTPSQLAGGNLMARWQHSLGPGSDFSLQGYYDHTRREQADFQEDRQTLDLEAQHRRTLGRHQIVAGFQGRISDGDTSGVPTVRFEPPSRRDTLWSGFVRDEVSLAGGDVRLTGGLKLERNTFSGLELQPSVQALWTWDDDQAVWASLSRAVRTPSRLETDVEVTRFVEPSAPTFVRFQGDPAFVSETVVAWEGGYRRRLGERALLDVAAFYNQYDDLLSLEPGTPFRESGRLILPQRIGNGVMGHTYGFEAAADAQVVSWLRLHGSWSMLRLAFESSPGSADTSQAAAIEGSSPRHQLLLRATSSPTRSVQLDAMLRRVSELPAQDVSAYTELDARAAWQPMPLLDLAVVGRSLLQAEHGEFRGEARTLTPIGRSLAVEATLRW